MQVISLHSSVSLSPSTEKFFSFYVTHMNTQKYTESYLNIEICAGHLGKKNCCVQNSVLTWFRREV